MRDSTREKLQVYTLILAAWTVVGIFFFTQGLIQKAATRDPTPWWHYLVSWLTGVYLCAALTPLILWAGDRHPFGGRRWPSRVTLHLLFSFLFSVVELALHSVVLTSFGLFPRVMTNLGVTFGTLLFLSFHQNVASYWTVLGLQCAFRYYARHRESERQAFQLKLHASELETQLASARLSALKMQLQPHFLFNTLNAIVVLVRQGRGGEAEEMLARLSDLLRCVLDNVEAQQVPLRRELDCLQFYLSIQQVRFQDRLRIEIDVQPEALAAYLPQMALQPLIENAVQHGIARSVSAETIRIRACRAGNLLEIQVHDDGPGLENHEDAGHGIGLSNTRARLQQLYGDRAQLTLNPGSPLGAVSTMAIPWNVEALGEEREAAAIACH